MWKLQYSLEINSKKIIEKSCHLITIIFFAILKNAHFYNHIPDFKYKTTIKIILFFSFMGPTVSFGYFLSNIAECQTIVSNEISFWPLMIKTWQSFIRRWQILNYVSARNHRYKYSHYSQTKSKIVPTYALFQVCCINVSFTRISFHVMCFTSMLVKTKSFSMEALQNHSNKMGSVNTEELQWRGRGDKRERILNKSFLLLLFLILLGIRLKICFFMLQGALCKELEIHLTYSAVS